MADYIYSDATRQPNLNLIHVDVAASDMTNKNLEYCSYDQDSSQITVSFDGTLNSPDETSLNGIVEDSYTLPGVKTDQINLLKADTESYLGQLYSIDTRDTINMLLTESIRDGLSDRIDYINPWKSWVETVYSYEKDKETEISDSTSIAQAEAVSWDFSQYDSSNPDISVKGVLTLVGDSYSSTFEGYLERMNATNIKLVRYNGQYVIIGREILKIPAAGRSLSSSDNLITSDGTDAGSAMSADNLYYVYASNSSASVWPTQLRASTTTPSLLNGIKYLGTSGNAKNWRFVGWVYPTATGFKDDENQRLVINQYNRRRLYGYLNPGYNNNDSATSASFTNTNFEGLSGGNSSKFSWIATGDDSISYEFDALVSADNGYRAFIGIGEDSETSAAVAMATPPGANMIEITTGRAFLPGEGFHYLKLLGCVEGGTGKVWVDSARRGSTADPRVSFFSVILFG